MPDIVGVKIAYLGDAVIVEGNIEAWKMEDLFYHLKPGRFDSTGIEGCAASRQSCPCDCCSQKLNKAAPLYQIRHRKVFLHFYERAAGYPYDSSCRSLTDCSHVERDNCPPSVSTLP